jgi:hypothetical protein
MRIILISLCLLALLCAAPAAAVRVTVTPPAVTIETGATQQFTATVTGAKNAAVTWTCTGGSITSTGFYTAPATPGTYTVRARSVARSSATATVTVAVTSLPPPPPTGSTFYASPSGNGNGAIDSPWGLQTALDKPLAPGSTLYLRGGTYRGNFTSNLTGTAAAPIIVRQYPGERAILDGNYSTALSASMTASQSTFAVEDASRLKVGDVVQIEDEDVQIYDEFVGNTITGAARGWNGTSAAAHSAGAPVKINGSTLTVQGAHTWYWGFEVTNSDPQRLVLPPRSYDTAARGAGLNVFGPNTKFINLLIYDNGNGVGFWEGATDAELYGCLIFNNGWEANGARTGHGIYAQNSTGTKRIVDCVTSGTWSGFGFHVYGSDEARLKGFHIEGNINPNERWLIGGGTPAGRVRLQNNFVYGQGISLGLSNPFNEDAVIDGNYIHGGIPLDAKWWASLTVSNNTVIASGDPSGAMLSLYLRSGYPLTAHAFTGNAYYGSRPFYVRAADGAEAEYSSLDWQGQGKDATGTYSTELPSTPAVFIRPNQYEPGRAHVAVFNWGNAPTVSVDLSASGLSTGQAFEIRSATAYFAAPVYSGTYDGSPVSLPIVGEFASFVVRPN